MHQTTDHNYAQRVESAAQNMRSYFNPPQKTWVCIFLAAGYKGKVTIHELIDTAPLQTIKGFNLLSASLGQTTRMIYFGYSSNTPVIIFHCPILPTESCGSPDHTDYLWHLQMDMVIALEPREILLLSTCHDEAVQLHHVATYMQSACTTTFTVRELPASALTEKSITHLDDSR